MHIDFLVCYNFAYNFKLSWLTDYILSVYFTGWNHRLNSTAFMSMVCSTRCIQLPKVQTSIRLQSYKLH